jgi:uncharacterized protein with HEPN domain
MQPDEAALLDVAYCCGRIVALTEHVTLEAFEADEALREAVQYRLIVAGEAVKRLSPEFRATHGQFAWASVAGLRDILVHAYERVDYGEIWNIATTSVPRLLEYVGPLLPRRDE